MMQRLACVRGAPILSFAEQLANIQVTDNWHCKWFATSKYSLSVSSTYRSVKSWQSTNSLTWSVRVSAQDIRILSGVHGESSLKPTSLPASFLAAWMADFMAKNTDEERNNGGSPTACKSWKVKCWTTISNFQHQLTVSIIDYWH